MQWKIVKISFLPTFPYVFVNSILDVSKYLQHELPFMGERTSKKNFEDSVGIYMEKIWPTSVILKL